MKKAFFILWGLLFLAQAQAQDVTISLLTCSPGGELYSTYGHSAILVENKLTKHKTVYNYGTFDFHTTNFALKFIKGDLLYKLNPDPYRNFIYEYKSQGRGVIKQELDISPAQKKQVVHFLAENMKPANRNYLYDFFFDNCSTRIRDLFETTLQIQYPSPEHPPRTYRTLLKPYLSDTPWYHFGTNLILGSPTDDKADMRQEMFLPDYLSENLAKATLDGHPFLKPAKELIPRIANMEPATFNAPIFAMILILLLSVVVSIKSNKNWQGLFDTFLFGAAVLSGFLFVFMWVATRHEVCHQNFNLLWGNPLFLFLPIFALRKSKQGWKLAFYYAIFAVFAWYVVPQKLPLAMFFFLLALVVRSAHRSNILFVNTNSK